MLCLGSGWALIVDVSEYSCGRGVDEYCLHRCNSWGFRFLGLWIWVGAVSTEEEGAVGKDTKISMNFCIASACRMFVIKKGKAGLKRKCIDAE